jgi:hypothetical protein
MTATQRYTRLALTAIFTVGCFAAGLATGVGSLHVMAVAGLVVGALILAHN